MANLSNRLVDGRDAIIRSVLERTGGPVAQRALELRAQLQAIERRDGRLAVVMHDNPDPDAIASAVALVDIAASFDVEADACYSGQISHQENRAMVNLLDLDLRRIDPEVALEEYAAFALVDHAHPGVNDPLPEDLHVDIVIDHHPPRGPVSATVYDLREDVGATSTILTEYLEWFDVPIDRKTATALLYGIWIDTNDFTREAAAADFRAAAALSPSVDTEILRRVEQPTVDGDTFDTIARAIQHRVQRGSIVAASAGRISNRDALPQAADQLLAMEGVDTTLVFGFRDEMAYLSARSRGNDVDLGEVLRDAFDQIGSAGGHADMAGAQLEVGILAGMDDQEQVDSIVSVVEEVISDRFFEAMDTQEGTPVSVYDRTSEWLFRLEDGESA